VVGAVIGALLAVRIGGESPAPVTPGVLDGAAGVIGQPAPDFALESVDGSIVRLSDYRGQTVVINFWATWCLPCYLEMPELNALHEERASRGDLVVLAINIAPQDSRQGVENFIEELGLTLPVLLETDEYDVSLRYELERLPGTFFIDRDGILREVSYGLMVGDALTGRVEQTEAAAASE
jgi:cytochrome c biogenesis protein CcmG, thiol:disulfide interchange protein DsbE